MFKKQLILILFFGCNTGLINSYCQDIKLIPTDQIEIDGAAREINPGDTLKLEPGLRSNLSFKNLVGTKEKPIVIVNDEEKVIIDTDAHTAILFENCSFVQLTGTGSSDKYGIEIASAGTMGVSVTEFSTNFEIDHLEIHQTGFAGIMAKTDPNCDRQDVSEFVMKDLSFHDNYIYDTGGEGFYVGYSWYPTREVDCNDVSTILYPHPIHEVRIYNNIIKDTGWDGLQVGSSPQNVQLYGNYIENYGIEDRLYQNHAVQIGAGTTGDFYNNFIYNGTGGGVSFFGSGNNRLFNNIIVGNGENAIYHNDKGAEPGTKYQIYNNTIVNPGKGGIDLNASKTNNNLVANNLIVLGGAVYGITGDGSKWTSEGNQVYNSVEDVGFKHADTLNFRLTESAKAVDAGYGISYLNFDFDFNARPANTKYDVGAFELGAEIYVPVLSLEDEEENIVIFPNPGSGIFNIRMANKITPDSMIISDELGRIVFSKDLTLMKTNDSQINIQTNLEAGIYLLKIYHGDSELTTRKLMINNRD